MRRIGPLLYLFLAFLTGVPASLCGAGGRPRPNVYNLLEDPAEARNRASEHPDRVEHLTRLARVWNDTLPR